MANPDDAGSGEKAGEILVDALEGDGTFLDGACADGSLMEDVQRRAGRRGLRIEPYGVELVPGVAELARRRLPRWADRIWTGDLLSWTPPRRFDTVRIGLGHAAPALGERLVARVLEHVVAPGGRLLVGPYAEDAESYGTVEQVRDWGFPVGRILEVPHPDPGTVRRLLVLPAPAPRATVTSLDERRGRRPD